MKRSGGSCLAIATAPAALTRPLYLGALDELVSGPEEAAAFDSRSRDG